MRTTSSLFNFQRPKQKVQSRYPLREFVWEIFFYTSKKGAIGAFFVIQLYSLCFILYTLYSLLSTLYSNTYWLLAKFNIKASALILNLSYHHRSPTLHILLHRLVLHIFFDASVRVLNSDTLVTVCDLDRLARCRAFYRWGRWIVVFFLSTR